MRWRVNTDPKRETRPVDIARWTHRWMHRFCTAYDISSSSHLNPGQALIGSPRYERTGVPQNDACNLQSPMERSGPRIPTNILGTDFVIKSLRMDRVSLCESVLRFLGELDSKDLRKGQHESSKGVAKSVIYQGNM